MRAAISLPAKPMTPAERQHPEVVERPRVDQAVDRLDPGDGRADEDRGDDEVARRALGRARERSRNAAPSGIAVSASPTLWIRSASSATLPVAAKMTACATAVASRTARLADTARTPSRERVIDGSTSPCEWPCELRRAG